MIKLELPFWLNGKELTKLKAACQRYWEKVQGWLTWPLLQLDPLTCQLDILNLLAWQRDITRFKNEPEHLYRLRVKYAYINAVDAGSVAGFIRIFERLEIGYTELDERQEGRDWDIVTVNLTDSQVANNHDLLMTIIYMYGRTCRRYEFSIINPLELHRGLAEFSNDYMTFGATAKLDGEADIKRAVGSLNNDNQTYFIN